MGFLIIPIIQIKKLRLRVNGVDCPAPHGWHMAELTSEPRAEILNPESLVLTTTPCGLCYLISFCTMHWNWSQRKKRQTESKSKCSLQPSTCWTQRTWVISTRGKIRRGLCLARLWREFPELGKPMLLEFIGRKMWECFPHLCTHRSEHTAWRYG